MARAIERLAKHWLATKGERKSHTLKLKDGDLTVWWSPWTLGQQDAVYHDYDRLEGFRPERFARVVLAKAETEAGERMFADVEKIELMSMVDPRQIIELGGVIVADLVADSKAAGGDPKAMTATAPAK